MIIVVPLLLGTGAVLFYLCRKQRTRPRVEEGPEPQREKQVEELKSNEDGRAKGGVSFKALKKKAQSVSGLTPSGEEEKQSVQAGPQLKPLQLRSAGIH